MGLLWRCSIYIYCLFSYNSVTFLLSSVDLLAAQIGFIFECVHEREANQVWLDLFVYVWGCPLCESIYWFDIQGHSVSSASNGSHKAVKRFQIYYWQMKQTHLQQLMRRLAPFKQSKCYHNLAIISLFLQKEICLDLSCKNDCQGGVRTHTGFWIDFFDL